MPHIDCVGPQERTRDIQSPSLFYYLSQFALLIALSGVAAIGYQFYITTPR